MASTAVAQIPALGPAVTLWTSTSTGAALVGERYLPLSLASPAFTKNPSQLELREVTPTQYQGAVTFTGPNSVVAFNFNPVTGTVTPNNHLQPLNANAPFAASISEDGLVAVVDQTAASGGPKFATRPNRNVQFGAAQPIVFQSGFVSASGYPDSKIYMEGNQYRYAYVDAGGNITAGRFNPFSVPQVTNEALIIPQGITGTSTGTSTVGGLHSHHPLTRQVPPASGNWVVLGWIFSQNPAGNDSDTYWLPSRNGVMSVVNQGAYPIMDTTGWQNNGTFLGGSGSLIVSDNGAGAPWHLPIVGINNAVVPAAGGQTTVRFLTEYDTQNLYRIGLCFGAPFGPLPLNFTIGNTLYPAGQLSPRIGQVGLTLVPSLVAIVSPANPGGLDFTFNAPPLPAGTVAPMQAIAIKIWNGPPAAGHQAVEIFTGNTAVIEWQ